MLTDRQREDIEQRVVAEADYSEAIHRLGLEGFGFYLGFSNSGHDEARSYAHELWQDAVLDRRPNVLIGGERIPVPA